MIKSDMITAKSQIQQKIHLVQVNDIIGTNVILPLAIGILWQNAIMDPDVSNKWELGEVVYKKENIDSVASKLAQGDIICFSNYIWNSSYHFALATAIKKINPEIFIVVGGPDIGPDKKYFWQEYQDIVNLAIVGEGERSFVELLKSFPNVNPHNIPGAWTKDVFNGEAERIEHLPYYNSPYLNGFYDRLVEKELALGNNIQAVVQTNRGCPYRCTFCEEGREYKNKMFFYDSDRIKEEFEWCAKNKVGFLSIADDNWGIAQIDVEYFRFIRDLKLKYGYPEVVDATYAKNAPERLLQLADIDKEYNTRLIRGFTVALQSLNPSTLTSIKRFNLMPLKQLTLINGLKERNMPTYTEIIWPLPHENYDSFIKGLDKVIDLGLDNWMGVYPLGLHEGTELYEDFLQDFKVIKQQNHNDSKQTEKHVALANTVIQSTWVDTDDIIKGQLLYTWLVALFFFGYSRPLILDLRKKKNISTCKIINDFLIFVDLNPQLQVSKFNQKIKLWWSEWYNGRVAPNISLFPDQDTSNWSPYAHLASYIQSELEIFNKEFKLFIQQQSVTLDEKIYKANHHSVMVYSRTYPYTTSDFKIDSNHPIPEFKSLYEFCRYYYWWKRKNGWHRAVVTDSNEQTE